MKADLALRQQKDQEYADMIRDFPQPSPEVLLRRAREQRVRFGYKRAEALRQRLQARLGRLPNKNRQQLALPPIGNEGKLEPHTKEWKEQDWYTPLYPEVYSEEGSFLHGLLSMRASHQAGHPEFKDRGIRPVTGCLSCKSHVYRRKRRYELKRDIVAWLDCRCYLCLDRNILDSHFSIVRLWGGSSSIGRRLHHSAADLEQEVRDNYVLVCPACMQSKGRKGVYEKARLTHPGFTHPPPRQGRHPRVKP